MTISGSVTSSKPIPLSKASSILKTFIATETGASQASAAFLRRSSASFIELVQFHRNLRAGKPEKKQKVTALEDHEGKSSHLERRDSLGAMENGSEGEGSGRKRKKKKNKVEVVEEKRERKKRKKEEDGSKSLEDSEDRHSRKKKRRKHDDAQ